MHADAVTQRRPPRALAPGVPDGQALAHLARRLDRTLGMARLRDGGTEHGFDLVADVLEHEATVAADGRFHLGEVGVEVAHYVARIAGLHPRREVAQVREEDRHLAQLTFEGQASGEDLVADLLGHVLAERLLDELALLEAVDHSIEALGQRTDLVVGHDGTADVEAPALDLGHRRLQFGQRLGHAECHRDQRRLPEQRHQDRADQLHTELHHRWPNLGLRGNDECHFGRSILHVVGNAVALPSTLASLFQPSPVSSASYLTFFDSVET